MTNIKRELFIQMVLTQWTSSNQRVEKFFEAFSEEQFKAEVAPNANTAAWLLCHLTVTNDKLFSLLGIGKSLYPEFSERFDTNRNLFNPDSVSKNELYKIWKTVTGRLQETFSVMTTELWFEKHTAVSEDDFLKEPHRNRLNVLIGRINHQSHHIGQLALLKK